MVEPSKKGDVHLSSQNGFSRRAMLIIALVVVHLAIGGVFLVRHWQQPQANIQKPRKPRPQTITIGGIDRPMTDIKPRTVDKDDFEKRSFEFAQKVGKPPTIPKDANPMVASVVDALESGEHPERLSSMITPGPFNQDAYQTDPNAYLNVVEPGRIWQVAQPGPDVPRLKSLSSAATRIEQGETISLKVQALPGSPVTFTSFDLGSFQNRLTSITVRADEKGVATGRLTAIPGTINDVRIVAGSPTSAGNVRFLVNVSLPMSQGL